MRRSGLAVWKAHQIAGSMVRPGATTREIDAAVAEYFRSRNGEPLFLNYPNHEEGKPAFPAVTCMSKNEAVVHGIPDDVPLKEGDILSLDTGVRIGGWCGDAAWTPTSVGEVSARRAASARRAPRRCSSWPSTCCTPRPAGRQVASDDGPVRERPRLHVGGKLRRPRHWSADARGPPGAELRQPILAGAGRLPDRAGPGDRRRADGQHGRPSR